MSDSKKESGEYTSIENTERWRDWQAFKGKRESDRDSDPFAQRERELKIELAEARLTDLKARTSDRESKRSDRDLAAELAELEAKDRDTLEAYHGIVTRSFIVGSGAIFASIAFGLAGFVILILIGIVLAVAGIYP